MSKYLVRMADERVARLAARNLAEEEYWYGQMDSPTWAKVEILARSAESNRAPPTENGVYTTMLNSTPIAHRKKVVEIYCCLREDEIYSDALANDNPNLVQEIKRIKEIFKLYTGHHQLDVNNSLSRHTLKYALVLLIVIVAATLLGGNGP